MSSEKKEIENYLSEKGVNYKIWDFNFEELPKNPNYIPSQEPDDVKWLQEIYLNMLRLDLTPEDKGLNDWIVAIKNGTTREQIVHKFKTVATENKVKIDDILDKDDQGRRIAMVMPESAGDVLMCTSLLPSIKRLYPEHNIYFITKPQFFEMIAGHPSVHKVIPFFNESENLLFMEGTGKHNGYFEVCYLPHIGTQKILDYLHNGVDKIELNLKDYSAACFKQEYDEFLDRTLKEI